MSSDQVCRICLSVDVRMISLVPLKDVYEKVTNFPLQADKKPVTACYMCVAELKRCFKFITKSVQAEDMMETLLKTQSDITPKSVAVVDREVRGLCHSYKVTPVKHESFDSEYLVVVKSEPLLEEEIHVKEEGDPLTENMAVSEGEDDNSEDDIPLGSIQQVKSGGAPGSSQAQADVQSDSEQPPLPLEVNIKVEDNDSDDGSGGEIKRGDSQAEESDSDGGYSKTEDGNYQCHICSKVLGHRHKLLAHIKTHNGEKYECKVCKLNFMCKNTLKKHLRTHYTEKPCECHICHRFFSSCSNLNKHIRTHTGEKPYECTVCSRKFSQMGNLKMHLRTHTGEKPYTCKVCKLEFRLMSALIRHERTHTGERPFECKICNNTFGQMSTLTRHMRKHTGEKPYHCNLCEWKFGDSTTLRRHLATHIDNDD